VLSKLSPTCLEDIIACVALFRPGPMDSIDTFISRKHGESAIEYKIPELASILDVTYGCIVYQEQVMQICRLLAGYSYARADLVRRAMSKKKTDAMNAERENFVNGCAERGIGADIAIAIFDDMVGFAKYAFNKSHATAYGVISYRTAYLKAHYPAEYFAALMTSVLDNTQKLREYIADASKCGVKVLPPDINLSSSDFSISDGNIRFGLLAIRNVGRLFTDAIVRARKNGNFKSFDEFVIRLADSDINKRTLESFIKCGVFDSLGVPRSALMASYEDILEAEQGKKRNNISGQMDLFSFAMADQNVSSKSTYSYPQIEEYSLKELLYLEKESSGMYFSGHIIDDFSKHIEALSPDSISAILEDSRNIDAGVEVKYKDSVPVKIAGIITGKKTKVLKNGDTMAFITVEDRIAEIEIVVFAKSYAKYSDELTSENAVLIEGRISIEEGEEAKILLSKISPLLSNSQYNAAKEQKANTDKTPSASVQPEKLFIKLERMDESKLMPIYRLANLDPGRATVAIFDASVKKYVIMKGVTISLTEKVLGSLRSLYGDGNVAIR
jgi:DNA polymerase-3 subunit alpha